MRSLAITLILAGVAATSTGCRYAGPWIENYEAVELQYEAGPSTSVYATTGKLGEYRLARYEGEANVVFTGGEAWALATADEIQAAAGRSLVQPVCRETLQLVDLTGGRVQMTSAANEGDKITSTLRFVSGTWDGFVAGADVVLAFEDASFEAWSLASQDRMLEILDRERRKIMPILDERQGVTDAAVFEFVVDEKPLVRASKRELLVFFEALRMEGGFAISTREKDPRHRFRWVSYSVRPEVGEFLSSVGEVSLAVALITLDCYRATAQCR